MGVWECRKLFVLLVAGSVGGWLGGWSVRMGLRLNSASAEAWQSKIVSISLFSICSIVNLEVVCD